MVDAGFNFPELLHYAVGWDVFFVVVNDRNENFHFCAPRI
jgi:hypothetical protein